MSATRSRIASSLLLSVWIAGGVACGGGRDDDRAGRTPATPAAVPAAPPAPWLTRSGATATSTVRSEPGVAAYTARSGEGLRAISAGLEQVARLDGAPEYRDVRWRRELQGMFERMEAAATAIRSLTPPPCMQPAHEAAIRALDALDFARTDAFAGIALLDAGSDTDGVAALQRVQKDRLRTLVDTAAIALQFARC